MHEKRKGKGITFKKHKPEKVKSNCHTSPASPTYDEIDHMTHKLSVAPRLALCTQLNGSGSGCTDHARRKGGQLGVCGDLLFAVRCRQLAWAGKFVFPLSPSLSPSPPTLTLTLTLTLPPSSSHIHSLPHPRTHSHPLSHPHSHTLSSPLSHTSPTLTLTLFSPSP